MKIEIYLIFIVDDWNNVIMLYFKKWFEVVCGGVKMV